MTRIPLLLLPLLAACATTSYAPEEYQQAAPAYRPAPRPPAVTPGYRPNTPPPPEYAPEGAGASHGGVVTTPDGKTVPRSPYKRVLPSSKESGVWAADGAPVASRVLRTHIFGVDLPLLPAEADDVETALLSNLCVDSMNKVGAMTGHDATISKLPEPARTCMASLAYLRCAAQLAERHKHPTKPNASTLPKLFSESLKAVIAHGRMQVKQHCPEGTVDDQLKAVIEDLIREWSSAMDASKNPLQ